jgi:Mn-dependent DtxR family transcriptional regulator
LHPLRPDFAQFLNKIYDLTRGELRIINQYQVGEGLELSSKQTDKIVYELSNTGMIKKVARNKIVLSPHALYVIHNSKN